MGHRLLIVDDEQGNLDLLDRVLTEAGFCVLTRTDATYEDIAADPPDLLILDWLLKNRSGLDVLAEIRASPFLQTLPVMVMSGQDAPADRIAGLRAGADDYLCKPFPLEELRLRVETLLRRTAGERRRYSDARIQVDASNRVLTVRGEPRTLGPLEWSLLGALLDSTEPVPAAALRKAVWGKEDHAQSRNTLATLVSRLRAVLEADPDAPRYIIAVGGSYRFERRAPV